MPREYVHYAEIVEYIQITFVTLYKLQLAKASLFAYNKDRKREASRYTLPYTRKGDGVAMLKMHTLAKWMYGFLEPERPYGLPEDVYNDVIPSGIHNYNRNELF